MTLFLIRSFRAVHLALGRNLPLTGMAGLVGISAATLLLLAGSAARAQMSDTTPGGQAVSAPGAAASAVEPSDKLSWGIGFVQWPKVTGYIFTRSHGGRLAVIRVTPLPAAQAHVRNGEHARHLKRDDWMAYPPGTLLSMETWDLNANWGLGAAGPLFFMRKEAPGYDPAGGDWRYAMTRADMTVLAEGIDGRATACRTCHQAVKERDFVPATDR